MLFTPGRAFHIVVAFAITGGCASLWGYTGLAVGGFGIVALGWIWEALSPLFNWPHPWGDVLDFCAFEVGQLAGVGLWYIMRGGT